MSAKSRGLTLVELLLFIIIVGVSVAGVLAVFDRSVRASSDPLITKQAQAAAESLMEEILLKEFANPAGGYVAACPGTCARNLFDDVFDYNNYSSTGIADQSGAAIAALASYDASVVVAHPAAAIGGIAAANIWQVTVTITHGTDVATLGGLKYNF